MVSELTKRYLKRGSVKNQEGSTTTVTTSMAQTEVGKYKTYEYDSFNKTAQTVVEKYKEGGKETHIQRNFYDAENLRYGIEEDGERTNFVTNGWSVFTELDAEWKPTKRLVRGYGIIASEECGHEVEESITTELPVLDQYHFYHQNEHGDTEYITGRDGKVKNAYTYDAFGNIRNVEELVKNRYTYNGEQYDQISQQYYLRARSYNPLIGRFTQEDVYRGDGLNLYAYCGNNPVMYVDPSGYSEVYDPTTNLYPPRTDYAQEQCQVVVDVVNDIKGSSNTRNSVISVFSHEDGTVSVGFSGQSGKWGNFEKKLQEKLDSIQKGKYTVSGNINDELVKSMKLSGKKVPETGNAIGDCAEPKAASAAHKNSSPITGMDTRNRFGESNHPYSGANKTSNSQMDPCDTCRVYEKEYMEYANSNDNKKCK